tara:strand:- start:1523 stop:1744 length:222 start_codon:yes stop_codon:yes gene_type:complete
MSKPHYYGELRFVGLSKERLQEALLRCQIELLNHGLLEHTEVSVDKTDKHGEFVPANQKPFVLQAASSKEGGC